MLVPWHKGMQYRLYLPLNCAQGQHVERVMNEQGLGDGLVTRGALSPLAFLKGSLEGEGLVGETG